MYVRFIFNMILTKKLQNPISNNYYFINFVLFAGIALWLRMGSLGNDHNPKLVKKYVISLEIKISNIL